jgi:hypothetical protein
MRQVKPGRIKDAVNRGSEDVTAGQVIPFETEDVNIDCAAISRIGDPVPRGVSTSGRSKSIVSIAMCCVVLFSDTKDLVLPLLLFVYFHLAVVRVEEPALRQHFSPTYEEYCRRVPRWFPAPTSARRATHQRGATGGASRPS